MIKGKNNILVSIILLIFVGQAMASASLSCSMLAKIEITMQSQFSIDDDLSSMIGHDMSAMNMAMTSDMPLNTDDCCSGDNHCNMSSCFSLALSDETQLQVSYFSHNVPYFKFTMALSLKPSSLYRPPILV